MSQVKIVHVGKSLGGIDTYIRLIVKYLDPLQFKNVIIHGKNENPDEFFNKSGEHIRTYEIDIIRNASLKKDFLALKSAIRIIREEKPNVIHAHSSKGGFIGRIAAYMCKVQVIYTPNAFSYLSSKSIIVRWFYILIERILRLITSTFLACSNSEKIRGIADIKFKETNSFVWNNCIETHLDAPKDSNSYQNYVCSIGRPSYQKNTDFLIDVFHYFTRHYKSNITLKIIGVGHYSPLKQKVIDKISKYGLIKRVELLDWISRENTMKILQNSLCYISTSRYEGLSFSNLEALALGIPIIASDVDGNRDCVVDGSTGFLIGNWDVQEFAYALTKISTDKALRTQMSSKSIELFNKKFNIEKTISELEQIYLERSILSSS